MGDNTLRDEHFVAVTGFPNYEVSNYGRLVNVKTGREIRIQKDDGGNRYVKLFNKGKPTTIVLRRLIAQEFFTEYKSWMEVYLKSDDRSDCSVLNVTLQPVEHGEKNIRIVETGEEFTTMRAVAVHIGGSTSVIAKCLMGMGKSHKGYTFEYVH